MSTSDAVHKTDIVQRCDPILGRIAAMLSSGPPSTEVYSPLIRSSLIGLQFVNVVEVTITTTVREKPHVRLNLDELVLALGCALA